MADDDSPTMAALVADVTERVTVRSRAPAVPMLPPVAGGFPEAFHRSKGPAVSAAAPAASAAPMVTPPPGGKLFVAPAGAAAGARKKTSRFAQMMAAGRQTGATRAGASRDGPPSAALASGPGGGLHAHAQAHAQGQAVGAGAGAGAGAGGGGQWVVDADTRHRNKQMLQQMSPAELKETMESVLGMFSTDTTSKLKELYARGGSLRSVYAEAAGGDGAGDAGSDDSSAGDGGSATAPPPPAAGAGAGASAGGSADATRDNPTRVFCYNLPPSVSAADVNEGLLSVAGAVKDVQLRTTADGVPTGIAVADFETAEAAALAVERMNVWFMEGQPVFIVCGFVVALVVVLSLSLSVLVSSLPCLLLRRRLTNPKRCLGQRLGRCKQP